jgi:cytochrome c nitrite reductase small subunit
MKQILWPGGAGFLLSALLGSTLGSGAYTVYYGEALAYLSDDPKSCANCHIMRDHYDGWQKASHHAVATCNDCHTPNDSFIAKYLSKAENGIWHSKGFTLQDFHEPIRLRPHNRRILEANCVRCHSGLVREITQHHSSHADAVSCVGCHAQVGHGPTR